ncbi:MAG: glutamate/aspartate transport system substrate-binding protein [Candidatus Tokpelaia sp. JSC161]|jgi:glutamate/aspartate transport system substrate-binding protein|nr:MAG: glutamate/aspartate transport system substrate-binding protein [Candidatus Tokpelaia sp. JSC161]
MKIKKLFASTLTTLIFLVSIGKAQDTIEKVRQTGTITLGVRESSGLGYTIGKGKYIGFHTEMAKIIINDLSKQIKKNITINYLPITSANRIPLLQNGTYDFECGSTTNNRARSQEATFAYTTYVEEVRIAVKKNSGINNISDLNGKTVVTTTGTTSVQILRHNKNKKSLSFNQILGKDHIDSFLLLEEGRADAFVMDASILAMNIAKAQNPKDFIILDDILSVEPIACMLRLKDENLKNVINNSILRQVREGSLKQLYEKWFIKPIPPKDIRVGLPISKSTQHAWDNPNNQAMEDYKENS